MENWNPETWRSRIAKQQPVYQDQEHLADVVTRLAKLPPLVTSWEIEHLKQNLAMASEGKLFVIQGGDCSENLDDCSTDAIVRNLKVLMQMSLVLMYRSMKPVVRIGRIAGQYAKPRSKDTETRDGVTLPVYRGDIINRSGFSEQERQPDPELLLRGYERSALTLNFIRALCAGGFADLHHPENWDLGYVSTSTDSNRYQQLVNSIGDALQFMETVAETSISQLERVDLYTSHEGLHLTYEQSQTRRVPRRDGYYNLSTHFPWIGDRTRKLDGAHVEYFKGINNPIGLKIGPSMEPEELKKICEVLNPLNEPGRLMLIHRFGADKITEHLPQLIKAIQSCGAQVVWCSDPMHGNTFSADNGIKTRHLDQIEKELLGAFEIHRNEGSILAAAHLELTGDNVTECIGGARGLTENDLTKAYKSPVDPRLNYEQAMEISFLIAEQIQKS
ncbi:MAG: 3-deoxy-7-phosphoheptulonate synthase class II [Planctomycetota bacterium]|nr:3-deoxy-7-phosphoheptulonate synthase class II [Planctomycetota bacterium]